MRIRVTMEYDTGTRIIAPTGSEKAIVLDSEKRCLIACLKHFWSTYTEANQSVKIEEVK